VAPVVPALRRLRQEDLEFQVCLNYNSRTCLKKQKAKLEEEDDDDNDHEKEKENKK
jgi:hypothetical protein